MGIQELEVKGFRSLRDVRWTPGRLNVLIGPNGSGKSNLLQALEFLQKAAENKLSEEVLRQGGIVPLLWDNKVQEISWRLRSILRQPEIEPTEALYQLDLRQLGMGSSFRIEKELLQMNGGSLIRNSAEVELIDEDGKLVPFNKGFVHDDESSLAYTFFAGAQLAMLLYSLHGWSFYYNLRVDRETPARQAAIARFESRLDTNGDNLIPVLHTLYTGSREFKKNLDASMRAAFGTDYEEIVFPPAADQRIQLRLGWRSLNTQQSAANLSDGTLRFLMLIAILANPEPGDLIAIDEPETGLHPSMFPIIAELAAEAAERTQVIFTTHSPQFLDAFRDEAPTTTVAEWVDGETRLTVLDGEDLQRWLARYSLGSLFLSGQLEALT
jgi:predicted ATPase